MRTYPPTHPPTHLSYHNNRVMSVMDEQEEHGWEFVTQRKGVMVHRKFMPALNGVMSKFCCVRASGVSGIVRLGGLREEKSGFF